MAVFEYQALDQQGRTRKGTLEGDTASQVRRQLRDQQLLPLQVDAIVQTQKRNKQSRFSISSAELALFTRQLSTLLKAGIALEESLQTVAQQTHRHALQNLFLSVRTKVIEGHSLAEGLSQFPRVFPDLYRATVAAGEQAGFLEQVLQRLADYTESRHALRQKILLALFYPLILSIVAVLVVVGLLVYVVPQVVQVFEHTQQQLPLLTRMLMSTTDFLSQQGIYLILLLIGLFFAIAYSWRFEAVRYRTQLLLLRLPLLGRLTRGINAARFTQALSILSAGGVPLLDALRISAEIIPNQPMRLAIQKAAQQVREGSSLYQALSQSGLFPAITLSLIASGESSGQLQELLQQAAKNQEQETQSLINILLGLFEPLLILLMGAIVLMIVLAILMPVFELNQMVV